MVALKVDECIIEVRAAKTRSLLEQSYVAPRVQAPLRSAGNWKFTSERIGVVKDGTAPQDEAAPYATQPGVRAADTETRLPVVACKKPCCGLPYGDAIDIP